MSTRQIVEMYGMDLEKLWRGSWFITSTYAYLASALTPFPSISFLKFYKKHEWNKLTMAMAISLNSTRRKVEQHGWNHMQHWTTFWLSVKILQFLQAQQRLVIHKIAYVIKNLEQQQQQQQKKKKKKNKKKKNVSNYRERWTAKTWLELWGTLDNISAAFPRQPRILVQGMRRVGQHGWNYQKRSTTVPLSQAL